MARIRTKLITAKFNKETEKWTRLDDTVNEFLDEEGITSIGNSSAGHKALVDIKFTSVDDLDAVLVIYQTN